MKKKIIYIILVLVVILGVGIWYLYFRTPSFVITSDSVKVSKDQAGLINNFGYPNTFALAMDEERRLEVWKYYGLERSFVFKNGVFINDQIVDPLESFNAYPKLRPTQFKEGLTLEEASKVIDSTPTAQADIIPEIMKDSQVYSYSDQVLVGIKDNKVVFVQTLPAKTE